MTSVLNLRIEADDLELGSHCSLYGYLKLYITYYADSSINNITLILALISQI
jgi:hypothetical protein